MRLHGIELAKPDEWWIATHNNPVGLSLPITKANLHEYVPVSGEPVDIRGMEGVEMFLCRYGAIFLVAFAATGLTMGEGWSSTEAVVDAEDKVAYFGKDKLARDIIQWLETHPLSPRYRWTGGR